MKPSPNENPDLTAYALGELHARQATDIHALLADCPAATHELEQVEAVTDALRHGAPIPQDRLRPEQRHAVLYPAHLPRHMGTLAPRPLPRRSASVIWPIMTGVLKAAAVITLTAGAYFIGRHSIGGIGAQMAAAGPASSQPSLPAAAAPAQPADQTMVQTPVITPQPIVYKSPAPQAPSPELKESPSLLASAPIVEKAVPAPQPPAAEMAILETQPARTVAKAPRPLPMTTPGKHIDFVNASRQPVDKFALAPAKIRPLPAKVDRKQLLASPAPLKKDPQPKPAPRVTRTPDIYIHSWKAEVASCPWNESHRLLRVTIQLPADQPAALAQATYPLHVSFDPINVREYRQLCERHQPAAELRQAGTHIVWYEYLPNGTADATRTVATVTLDKGHFTTQTVGPFDSSRLTIQDRGIAWSDAREDFVFDSAVVGFGLLMRGFPGNPKLDHGLVLDLAEKSKGKDATGERARFIKLVQEAADAAGF